MENGGNQEHRPWKYDNTNETVNIYRNFVEIHYELVPYFLSAATAAYSKYLFIYLFIESHCIVAVYLFIYLFYPSGTSVMFPIADYTDFTPDSWYFIFE